MERAKRRLPIPQKEFGFTPDTFNLFQERTTDGERMARECEEAENRRKLAEAAQTSFFGIGK